MPSAMRLITVFLTVASFLQPTRTVAQIDANLGSSSSPVRLRARAIIGIVTRDGKRIDGAVLTLHRFLGTYSIRPFHADPEDLGETTAKNGQFLFNEVPSGKYVVIVRGGSIEVDLVKPQRGENDTIEIEDSSYSCVWATVVSAEGRKLKRYSPSACY